MYYFGSHWHGKKCRFQCNYVCSSPWMLRAYKKRPGDFTKEILAVVTTSRQDLLRREEYWLNRISTKQLGKGVYNLRRQISDQLWMADDQKRVTAAEKNSAANNRRKERGWTHSPEARAKVPLLRHAHPKSARRSVTSCAVGKLPQRHARI